MILMIDNYDSFVFNIYQCALISTNEPIKCVRNDEISVSEIKALNPSKIILSPGPKHPKDSGVCLDILNAAKDKELKMPLLGVCLGHQAMARSFGASIRRLDAPMHGKTSVIKLRAPSAILADMPSIFEVMRYHSLYVADLPPCLQGVAYSQDDNVIMALEHKDLPIYVIQFHPESYFTPYGRKIIENFVKL